MASRCRAADISTCRVHGTGSMYERLHQTADLILDARDNITDTVEAGVDIIADRHQSRIPAEIGGTTVEWADLNPFKSKKLR